LALIDRRNFHLFQPLLYQVATGALSPANIAAPLRAVLKRQKNTRVLLAEAVGLDARAKRLKLSDGELDYDTLIVATGSQHHYFGKSQWEKHAPGLKTIEDATDIRRRVLSAFEHAEREPDPEKRRAFLTFIVVGAGPTGVELAGALAEISRDTLKQDFRSIDPGQAQILLLEGADRVLPTYPETLSARATRSLERLGVTVATGSMVTDIQPEAVKYKRGGEERTVPVRTVLWAAGVQASPFARAVAEATAASLDRIGRLIVEPDLSLPGHPEILVLGDLAHFAHQTGAPLPGVAPVAMQQGAYAARLIEARLQGKTLPPFRYRFRGNMATIGRGAAVADLGFLRFSGFFAWLVWLFVHLLYLVEFSNRVLVLLQWAWNYFTRNRSARLITGRSPTG
jgi:NADH dehydrogenase